MHINLKKNNEIILNYKLWDAGRMLKGASTTGKGPVRKPLGVGGALKLNGRPSEGAGAAFLLGGNYLKHKKLYLNDGAK